MGSEFIMTEPIGKDGEHAEQKVWSKVQTALAKRDCIGYWRYPVFSKSGEAKREPDILLIDKQFGVTIIEVKGHTIDQILNINGYRWEYDDPYRKSGNPYEQGEDQLEKLFSYLSGERELRNKVTGKVLIALPLITKESWKERGFDQLPSNPPILFKEDLNKHNILQLIEGTPPVKQGIQCNDRRWNLLLSIISGNTIYRKPVNEDVTPEKYSRREIITSLNERLFFETSTPHVWECCSQR